MMPPPYQYKPLSPGTQTRIIELYPSAAYNGPLHCTLRDIDVDADPFFDALSYTWGQTVFTETLIVDKSSSIRITPNLRDALLRFRRRVGLRRLWVDALCINQADEEEKSAQIPFISRIYGRASSVLVWLGTYRLASESLIQIDLCARTGLEEQDPQEVLQHLEALLQLPWFSRRWVIQEVVLNPNVTLYCGQASMAWIRFLQLMREIASYQRAIGRLYVIQTMASLWRSHCINDSNIPSGPSARIMDLLSSFSSQQCADDRDRIYALAGLASDVTLIHVDTDSKDRDQVLIQVDYTLPVDQFYISFAVDNFEALGGLQYILQHCNMRSNGTFLGSQCSWVPDWRLPAQRHPLLQGWGLEHIQATLDRDNRSLKLETDKNYTMDRRGYVNYGIVVLMSDAFPEDDGPSNITAWLASVWDLFRDTLPLGYGQTLFHQLERVLFSSQQAVRVVADAPQQMDEFVRHPDFANLLCPGSKNPFVDTQNISSPPSPPSERTFDHIRTTMKGRRLLVLNPTLEPASPMSPISRWRSSWSSPPSGLTNRAVAVGPAHTDIGDIVCTPSIRLSQWLLEGTTGSTLVERSENSTFLIRSVPGQHGNTAYYLERYRYFYIGECRFNRISDSSRGVTWNVGKQEVTANKNRQRVSSLTIL
ncbi:heterokaryon incompatibility protein-domain-containing protein [Xylariales sp. PMI_506]|nr:heterokaryon incompatibility protein-domain-containing protein [Xylariales sp. PMI_506]